MRSKQTNSPWLWVPTLYFAQALPYVVVVTLSTFMYKNFGMSNSDMALYTGALYLPWVIKPLWSPFVEMFRTKRIWVLGTQLLVAAALALVALSTQMSAFWRVSLVVLWLMAFSSATHDIAADGFYMLGLQQHQQAVFVGVRSTFYRLATIAATGPLVTLAGYLATNSGEVHLAWSVAFWVLAAAMGSLCLYHHFVLPRPALDGPVSHGDDHLRDFVATFAAFFRKQDIVLILGFLLTFRLGEAQLLKMTPPFLLDPVAQGGLGLSTAAVGVAYGTIGITALTLGGLLGGVAIARFGLKRCLWPMVLCVHLPDLVFVYLATAQPQNFSLVCACVALEQFGYGIGFAAYLLYMIMVADGEHKTAHYAICTGFMALGMMVPGMASGAIEQALGYRHFFIWVCLATIPAFAMAALVKIDPQFGMKKA
jgi:MFS transporter, PAT family, beta-lactamase induction signal transducer AmpG